VTGWSVDQIRNALAARNYTLVGLARANGLHYRACIHAIHHTHVQGEQAIARCLDVRLHELWPDRWTRDDERIDRRVLPKANRISGSIPRQKRKAA